ncbi:MAG: hypothetical protein IT436_08935 [Phycisphaerales bacterium]|nr:hypothetical protein [Phycisphaerales bacterium]
MRCMLMVAVGGLLAAPAARADVATFYFAQVGQSYSAFMPSDDPLVGQEVVLARIYLDVESFPGSDAANFFTDISFPIEPAPGGTSALALTGADLGWSGSGTFNYFIETTEFNGVFIPRRYGAETPGFEFDGLILDGSRIEFITVPGPSGLAAAGIAGLVAARRRRA